MLERGNDGVFRSSLLQGEPWLNHGFGSRSSHDWPGSYIRVHQIHSAIVVTASDARQDPPVEGDGIVCMEPGEWVGIRTADCVSILIADPVTHSIGAFHAGWRGTVANIAAAGVSRMIEMFDARPQNLIAAIGPAIGGCCFDVGPEVAQEFATLFPETLGPLQRINLPEANRRQLVAAGIPAASVDTASQCTKCMSADFHSWRRDRDQAGRMVSAIQIQY